MISQARSQEPRFPNVEFREGSAEEGTRFLPNGSVDCIVAGQAAHWFDQKKLWPEMLRVLRSKGTVAFWGYKDAVFVDYPRASEMLQRYAYELDPEMLGSYWPQPGRSYVQDKLRVVRPPTEGGMAFEDVRRVEYEPGTKGRGSGEGTLFMEGEMKVEQFKGYVRTWSSYHGWKEAHPGQEARAKGGKGDVVDEMFEKMAQEEDKAFKDPESPLRVEWGSALIMARKK